MFTSQTNFSNLPHGGDGYIYGEAMNSFGKLFLTIFISILLFSLNEEVLAKRKHSAPAQPIYGSEQLTAELNRLVANVNSGSTIGIQIKSMRYGDTLYSRNQNQFFVPASILKILTAETALLYLGSEYKFPTVFVTDAQSVNQGVLQGNLFLVYSGDPSLTYYDLSDLIAALKAQNIYRITGNVYIDTSAYDQALFGPGWVSNDTRFCYSAPISASIINHNCMLLQAKANQHVRSVVSRIVQYNQSLIESMFRHYGVQVDGSILPGTAPDNLPTIAKHDSKPLRDLISEMLKKSENVIAGSLFKKMGEIYTKQPGSWERGSIAVKQILRQQIGVDTFNMNVLDGSGLSRNNQISPRQMMQVLDFAYHNNATNYDFISALPIAGVDGTLKRRMKNIAWKVRAKTGSMSGVVALAGYAISKNKEPLAFVIIINGGTGMGWKYKEMENRIMTTLTNYTR
jgi:D-alanyl-D-alanine carboxypeptidase/D-alanyl-D-alanine-endopeptidase (penicillin-binding protein 4)